MAATYQGPHGKVLRHGRDWHVPADHIPEYVLWWVRAGNTPNWAEAVEHFEDLLSNGPSPRAFTFKRAFDPDGHPARPDPKILKTLALRNAGKA